MRPADVCLHEKQQHHTVSVFGIPEMQDLPEAKQRGGSMTCYIHNVPGRFRIKLPVVKERPSKATAVQNLFADREGVEEVCVNPLTGSVLVRYDVDVVSPEQILTALRIHRFLDKDAALVPPDHPEPLSSRAGRRIGKALFGYAVGRALEANGLGLLAALM
jgi:hypothetical protein